MAVNFASPTTTRTSTLVSDYPENILIDSELNGRVDHTEVDDLAADIEANGQRTPVLIRKNDKGQPVLVYGHRRWRAVKQLNAQRAKAGKEPIKLECRYEQLADLDAFKAAIAENRFRKDASPMDDCHNITVLQTRFKKSVDEVAAIYFPEAHTPEAKASALKWVRDRAALVELGPEAAQAVKDGTAKITAAVALSRLSKDKQREVVAATKNAVKGATRIKVANVPKGTRQAAPAKSAKPASSNPAAAPLPGPEQVRTIIAAADVLAYAVDLWLEDATDKAEKRLIEALKDYRKVHPIRRSKVA